MKLKKMTLCMAALIGAGLCSTSFAAGFQLMEQNASGLGNAYAGSAVVAENASTIFFNPAGMTELKDKAFSAGVNMVRPSFKFTDEGSSSGTLSGNGGDAGGWNVVPNLYAAMAASDKVRIGVGVSAPFGLKTEYDNPWVGGAQSLSFEIKTINVNPSIAYQLDPQWSLGLGVNAQKLEAKYQRIAGTANAVYTSSLVTLTGDSMGYGWNAGLLFKPQAGTKVGLAYRSQVKHELEGDIQVTGPSSVLNSLGTSNMKADITLPDTWILSMSQQMGDVELLGDVERIGWGSIPKVDIVRTSGSSSGTVAQTLDTNYRDTWRVAFGANYQLNKAWKLKTGLAWDQTPVQNSETRLTSLPDNDRTWFSLGAQWAYDKDITLDVGGAYLLIGKTTINNNQAASGRGSVVGSYTGSVWIFGTQYSQTF